MLYALIGLSVFSMLVCWLIARRRKADAAFWVLMGLVLGPLAIPFAFFARPVRSRGNRRGD